MASLSFLSTTKTSPLHHPRKPHQPSPTYIAPTRRFHTSCNSTSSNNTTPNTTNTTDTSTKRGVPGSGSGSGSPLRLDRRNVLLGLGGLYGATSLPSREKIALGAPISPPDLSKCHLADGGTGVGNVQCCPPYSSDTVPIDYQFPASSKPLRIRRPAHLLEKVEIEKYKEAIAKMRELTTTDPSDPRGWMQQANVHCQYCNGAYDQVGYDNVRLQVHFSWLFLPWQRWYLHFYERILGSLIGDDSFALPYWNWDTQLQDCFNPIKLRYSYEEVELPWAEVGIRKKLTKVTAKAKTLSLIKVSEFGTDPKTLDKATIRVLVTRPKKSRSKTEKEAAVEVLVIKGIQAPIFEPSRFDVYITTPYEGDLVAPSLGEFAGSFVKLPHHGSGKDTAATKTKKSKLKHGINILLEDIDAEGAEKLVVSLVPRLGKVTVGGVSFDLLNT